MILWIPLVAAASVTAAVELFLLDRQRRLLVGDEQHRRFLVRYALGLTEKSRRDHAGVALQPTSEEAVVAATVSDVAVQQPARPPLATRNDGIVYVDVQGRLTFANREAQDLLQWKGGELLLGEILIGGVQESEALLERLVRESVIEGHATTLHRGALDNVEISAVALRDRDDNFWGAALFIRRQQPAAQLVL